MGARAARGPEAVSAAREIQDWALRNDARVEYGRGKDDGSMVPTFSHSGNSYKLFATYTYGRIEIHFQHLKPKPPFDDDGKRLELLEHLNQVPGVRLPPDAINRRPSIRLDLLAAPEVMKQFLRTLDWTLQEIPGYGS